MDPPVCWRNRTRNEMGLTQIVKKTYSNNFPAGPQTSYGYGVTGQKGKLSLCYDNLHPNFTQRLMNGEVVMGDCFLEKTTRDYSDGNLFFSIPPTNTYLFTGDFGSQVMSQLSIPNNFTDAKLSVDMDAVLVKAYAKINKDTVMSSEILLGLGQTINMLRSPLSASRYQLERMSKAAKLRYGKTADSVTRANADAWLEYRYGMMPLFLDINGIVKMFEKLIERLDERRIVVRDAVKKEEFTTIPFTGLTLPTLSNIGYSFSASGSVHSTRSAVISSGVVFEVKPRSLAQELAAQLQLGGAGIFPGLWEQIPFSFVADWFLGVGDWLSARNLPPDVYVKGNWTSVKRNFDDNYIIDSLWCWANNIKRTGSGGSASKQVFNLSRMTNRPLPALPVVTQRWATITHALDAASLLYTPVKALMQSLR